MRISRFLLVFYALALSASAQLTHFGPSNLGPQDGISGFVNLQAAVAPGDMTATVCVDTANDIRHSLFLVTLRYESTAPPARPHRRWIGGVWVDGDIMEKISRTEPGNAPCTAIYMPKFRRIVRVSVVLFSPTQDVSVLDTADTEPVAR